jgi:hypothetical protein
MCMLPVIKVLLGGFIVVILQYGTGSRFTSAEYLRYLTENM